MKKPSQVFEGEGSSLRQAFDEATAVEGRRTLHQALQEMEERIDKKFPRLTISINESIIGWRDERVEADGQVMKDFLRTEAIKLVEEAYTACEVMKYKNEWMSEDRPFTTEQMVMWNEAVDEVTSKKAAYLKNI